MPNEHQSFDIVVLGAGTGGYSAAFRAGQLGLRVALVDDGPAGIGGTCLHCGLHPHQGDARVGRPLRAHPPRRRVRHLGERPGRRCRASSRPAAIASWRRLVQGPPQPRQEEQGDLRARPRPTGGSRSRCASPPSTRPAMPAVRSSSRPMTSSWPPARASSRCRASCPTAAASSPATTCCARATCRAPSSWSAPARWAWSSPATTTTWAARSRSSSTCPPSCRSRTPRSPGRWSVPSSAAASRSSPAPASTRRRSRRTRPASASWWARRARRPRSCAPSSCWWPPVAPPTRRTWAWRPRSAVVERALVKVDGHMRTAEPHLYAIGDIIGGLWLAHVAAHEGIAAVHAIAGEEVEPVDYVKMPRATYARPQVASIGLTSSAECEADGRRTRRSASSPSRPAARPSSTATRAASSRSSPTPRRTRSWACT